MSNKSTGLNMRYALKVKHNSKNISPSDCIGLYSYQELSHLLNALHEKGLQSYCGPFDSD